MDNLVKAHTVIEKCNRALLDGDLDYSECLDLIPLLSATESAVNILKQAVIDRKNELANMPVRNFAKKAVQKR